jgi:phospholipase/lecithinase/hemolysin
MMEYTTSVNAIWSYQVPFELHIARRYPSAEMVIFDVHGLMTDIYNNPATYLTTSAPLNVTGFDQLCSATGCTIIGALDSFMWFDELHPS